MRQAPRILASCGVLVVASACKDDASPAAAAAPTEAKASETKAATDAAPKVAPPPVDPPITGDVVVRSGARLFFAPTGDAGFDVPPVAGAPGIPLHVVGEEGGRLVVETVGGEPREHHCVANLDGVADFRLRFHVAKDSLLPVLTDDLEHAFADGTKLKVARGVAVPAGSAEIAARGTAVRVPVPADRIGRSYKPGAAFTAMGADGELVQRSDAPLTYDGRTLAEDALFSGDRVLHRYGATERAGDALVTVRNPCLDATVLVSLDRLRATPAPRSGLYPMKPPGAVLDELKRDADADADAAERAADVLAVAPDDERSRFAPDEDVWGGLTGAEIGEAYGVGALGLVGTGRSAAFRVKPGAAVSWSDGRPAGTASAAHDFRSAPREENGRKCFDAALVPEQAASLALCFAPIDVEEVAVEAEGTIGLGNVGLIGKGGGYGLGASGVGGARVPSVRQAKAEIEGALDKDIIRRIVRAHINEVRHCYNEGLLKDPTLAGRVKITFTIGATGAVTDASVADDTVADKDVGTCTAKAVGRWKFPKPEGGGDVVVTYPFVFEPG